MNFTVASASICNVVAACLMLASTGLMAHNSPLGGAQHYEPAEVRPIWLRIDLNADGRISRSELREEDPRLLSRFDQADIDRDGKLSLRELEVLLLSV